MSTKTAKTPVKSTAAANKSSKAAPVKQTPPVKTPAKKAPAKPAVKQPAKKNPTTQAEVLENRAEIIGKLKTVTAQLYENSQSLASVDSSKQDETTRPAVTDPDDIMSLLAESNKTLALELSKVEKPKSPVDTSTETAEEIQLAALQATPVAPWEDEPVQTKPILKEAINAERVAQPESVKFSEIEEKRVRDLPPSALSTSGGKTSITSVLQSHRDIPARDPLGRLKKFL